MSNNKPWINNYPPDIPAEVGALPFQSVAEMLLDACQRYRDRVAFENFGKSITYGELDRQSRDFAAFLQSRFQTGDCIAVMMPNILQYPIAVLGILRAGMVVTNVNPLYTSRELKHQLNDADAKAIVIVENTAANLAKIIDQTKIRSVITTSIGEMLGAIKGSVINFVIKHVKGLVPAYQLADTISFKQAINQGQLLNYQDIKRGLSDLAFLQYTGGTTGVAKGAMLINKNLVANVTQVRFWIGGLLDRPDEVAITALPLYHIFALTANYLTFATYGARNILITNPRDMKGFVKEMSKHKFSVMTGVNTLFNGLLHTKGFEQLDFSKFKFTLGGGMAVQKDTATRWKEVTGVTLVEAYGLTETSPAACMNPINLVEYNATIGMPIPSTDCRIEDDEGNILPVGESGELCIKGPQVMDGYWNRPEETAKTLVDGWLKTGDIAVMSETGFFKIVDRKKDMILVSGFNVYPNEIEDVACLHPDIVEAAAIGVESSRSGETVKLFVVKRPNSQLSEEDVIKHCKENLTGYKRPRIIEFREELPKTNVGKILRRALKEE